MNTLVVQSVGVPEDASWDGQDGKVDCWLVPCSGTVDGNPSSFSVKIYGKGGDQKVKNGVTLHGEFDTHKGGTHKGEPFYNVKKANNPDLFPNSGGGGYGGGGGKGGGYKPQHELNALRVSESVVMKHYEGQEAEVSVEDLADKIILLANEKFIPFLKANTERHDKQADHTEAKKAIVKSIQTILQNNQLLDHVRANSVQTSEMLVLWEQSGQDAISFVNLIKQKYPVSTGAPASSVPPSAPVDDEDDIPF